MRRSERGANLVEAALVVPILILILAGVVDLGRAFYNYISLANAAREGARAGARFACYPGGSAADAAQRVVYRQMIVDSIFNELTGSNIDTAKMSPPIIVPDPVFGLSPRCPLGAERVMVTLTYPEDMILTNIIHIPTINLTATASMSRVGKTNQY